MVHVHVMQHSAGALAGESKRDHSVLSLDQRTALFVPKLIVHIPQNCYGYPT